MATYLNVQRAHKFVHSLKNINRRMEATANLVTALESVYDAMSAGDQAEVNTVLQELGYTLADLNNYYNELKNLRTYINDNLTVMQEPGW